MNSNIFTLNWKNVIGAVVSAVLSAVLVYIGNLTDITQMSGHAILNIAMTVGAASLLKAFLTNSSGQFVGSIPVK